VWNFPLNNQLCTNTAISLRAPTNDSAVKHEKPFRGGATRRIYAGGNDGFHGIFIIIFIGVMVALQVFGLRVYTLGATKLSATSVH